MSGAQALEMIDSMAYDLVFMDLMMPEMDGVETMQRIRSKNGNYFKISYPLERVPFSSI